MAGEHETRVSVVFPASVRPWVDAQCNGDESQYTVCDDARTVLWLLRLLPPPRKVLEIGAGIGRASVYFAKKMEWSGTEFFLLDGDKGTKQVAGVNAQTHPDHFYNSHGATRAFCEVNGIAPDKLHVLDAEKDWWKGFGPVFDLVYSFKAIGYHWPIGAYTLVLRGVVSPGGVVLFQTRSRNLSPQFKKRLSKPVLSSREKKIAAKVRTINEFLDVVRDSARQADGFEVLYCDMESDYGVTALRRLHD